MTLINIDNNIDMCIHLSILFQSLLLLYSPDNQCSGWLKYVVYLFCIDIQQAEQILVAYLV